MIGYDICEGVAGHGPTETPSTNTSSHKVTQIRRDCERLVNAVFHNYVPRRVNRSIGSCAGNYRQGSEFGEKVTDIV